MTASTTPVVAPVTAAAPATTSSPGNLPPPTAPTSASVSGTGLPLPSEHSSVPCCTEAVHCWGWGSVGLGELEGTAERTLHSRCWCSGEARAGRSPRSLWGFGSACIPVPPVCPRVRAGKFHCSIPSAR